jgi:hypothetical protein
MGRPKGKTNYPEEYEKIAISLLFANEKLLGKELKAKIEELRPGENYSLRTYQGIRELVLPIVKSLKKWDQPWHLGILDNPEYNISSEAINKILEMKKKLHEITIRQSKWINRLCAYVRDTEELYSVSYIYSLHEIEHEISQYKNRESKEFDTYELERVLVKGTNKFREYSMKLLDSPYSFKAFSRMRGLNFEDGE